MAVIAPFYTVVSYDGTNMATSSFTGNFILLTRNRQSWRPGIMCVTDVAGRWKVCIDI